MKKITISVLLLLVFVAAGNSRTIESTGVLEGDVISSEKNEPVDWTAIIIPELKRWQSTRDGHTFRFSDLPSGEYVLKTYRIGYKENRVTFKIMAGDTTHLILKLTESPLEGEHVTVTANRTENGSPLQNPDILISGKSLRKNLGKTIAETIENQPGIAQRTMGPAPARPIMRGLSGDRLLLLEDGNRTGDLSATSADHAVVIEPMTTESIEIIRGPETLLYGANTLGGVIDVKRNAIPNRLSNRITGSVSLAQESVNKGYSSGFNLMVPIQHFSLHFDGSFRTADDINTPLGTLGNTAIETLNGAAGISLFRSWGHAGVAFSQYTSDYGIPPDPLGGHPSGVDIAMDRRQSVSEVEVESFPGIQSLLLQHNYTRYYHEEIEKSGTIGMEFGVLSHHLSGKAKLQPFAFFKNSTLGFWSEYRDYASGGLSFTPATKEYSTAFFTYHEVELGAYTLNGSLRFDAKKIQPEEERLSRTVGLIRKRNFSGFSAAAAIERTFTDKFKSGLSFMHSFRAPGIEELFSEGPHLAAYSYEVGSADLDAETGNGVELFFESEIDKGELRLSLFQNSIRNYTFPDNTGERSLRRADLFIYRYAGLDAKFLGMEASYHVHLTNMFSISGSASYVEGTLSDTNEPLPRIPPLFARNTISFHKNNYNIGMTIRSAAQQDKISEFETPTAGYNVLDLSAEYRFSKWGLFHICTFSLSNATDAVYRLHLNRVKKILPEPGRNMRFLYKIYY